MPEIHAQAHHAAEFNRSVNQQREIRSDYMNSMWRRPHEQPASAALSPQQPVTVGSTDASIPTTRATQSPHATTSGMSQQHGGMVPSQSPQLLMTAPPYSAPIQAPNTISQSSNIRGMAQNPTPQHAKLTSVSFPQDLQPAYRRLGMGTKRPTRCGLQRLKPLNMVTPIHNKRSSLLILNRALRLKCVTRVHLVLFSLVLCHTLGCPAWPRATPRRRRTIIKRHGSTCPRVPRKVQRSRRRGRATNSNPSNGGPSNLSRWMYGNLRRTSLDSYETLSSSNAFVFKKLI